MSKKLIFSFNQLTLHGIYAYDIETQERTCVLKDNLKSFKSVTYSKYAQCFAIHIEKEHSKSKKNFSFFNKKPNRKQIEKKTYQTLGFWGKDKRKFDELDFSDEYEQFGLSFPHFSSEDNLICFILNSYKRRSNENHYDSNDFHLKRENCIVTYDLKSKKINKYKQTSVYDLIKAQFFIYKGKEYILFRAVDPNTGVGQFFILDPQNSSIKPFNSIQLYPEQQVGLCFSNDWTKAVYFSSVGKNLHIERDLYFYDFEKQTSKHLRTFYHQEFSIRNHVIWSPDNQWVAFSVWKPKTTDPKTLLAGVYIINVFTGELRPIHAFPIETLFSWM